MAMMARHELIALAAGLAVAVLTPALLLLPGTGAGKAKQAPTLVPLTAPASSPVAAAYARPLFAASQPDAAPADAPQLAGIAGRLGSDAVALVRTAEGTTRALRIGESVDGWSLASLSIDAAFFTRGNERVRVPLPSDQ